MFYTALDSFAVKIYIDVQVISIVQCCACFVFFNSMTVINNTHNMLIVFWGFD